MYLPEKNNLNTIMLSTESKFKTNASIVSFCKTVVGDLYNCVITHNYINRVLYVENYESYRNVLFTTPRMNNKVTMYVSFHDLRIQIAQKRFFI